MATLKNTVINGTGALQIPSGTTAQRPGTPAAGMSRWNTSTGAFEFYDGTNWSRSTSIVSSGLVFHVDANDYTGTLEAASSVNWNDKTANAIAMVPTGSPTMTYTSLNGVRCFKCNGQGYFESSSADGQKFYTGNGGTIEFWFYYQGIQPRRTVIEKAGDSYASYQQEFAFTLEPSGQMSTYRKGGQSGTYDYGGMAGFVMNQWNHVAIMLDGNAMGGWGIWNAGSRNYNYTIRDNVNLPRQSLNLRICTGYAGTVNQGYMAIVRIYNRTLTDNEVYQNFQAERERFGV